MSKKNKNTTSDKNRRQFSACSKTLRRRLRPSARRAEPEE